jgi:hypothetical protein
VNCEQTARLIPLFVGDDLDRDALASVHAHLGTCAGCSALADEQRAAIDLVREHGAFDGDADFYASIRRDVVGRLAVARRPRPWVAGLAIAATVAAAVLAGFVFYAASRRDPAPAVTQVTDSPPGTSTPHLAPPAQRAVPTSDAPPPRPSVAKRPVRRPAPPPPRSPAAEPSPTAEQASVTTIEFQTSDPNVRIIWFVSSSETPSTPSEETGS